MSNLETILAFHMHAAGIPAPVRQHEFHPTRKWRFDFAWPDRKLAVEVQGGQWVKGAHNRGTGMNNDARKNCAAVGMGWKVMYVTGDMVNSGEALNAIEEALTGEAK